MARGGEQRVIGARSKRDDLDPVRQFRRQRPIGGPEQQRDSPAGREPGAGQPQLHALHAAAFQRFRERQDMPGGRRIETSHSPR